MPTPSIRVQTRDESAQYKRQKQRGHFCNDQKVTEFGQHHSTRFPGRGSEGIHGPLKAPKAWDRNAEEDQYVAHPLLSYPTPSVSP